MSTYPPVTDRERDAALARIARRHRQRDDTRWSAAGLDEHSPPGEVLEHLRRHHATQPVGLGAHDIWDELTLAAWVHWDQRRRERERLHRARHYGLSYSELGRYVGIGTLPPNHGLRHVMNTADHLRATYAQAPDASGR